MYDRLVSKVEPVPSRGERRSVADAQSERAHVELARPLEVGGPDVDVLKRVDGHSYSVTISRRWISPRITLYEGADERDDADVGQAQRRSVRSKAMPMINGVMIPARFALKLKIPLVRPMSFLGATSARRSSRVRVPCPKRLST
jgi:hypothetical protein